MRPYDTAAFQRNTTFTATLAGGSSGAPVTFFKTGVGIYQITDNAAVANQLFGRVGVYGGIFRYSMGTANTTGKLYSADVAGGILQYASATHLDSGFTATVRSTGGSLGGIYLVNSAQSPTTLVGAGSAGGALILNALPTSFPDMSTLGDGKMWLGGGQTITASAGLVANSDGVYRLLGNTIGSAQRADRRQRGAGRRRVEHLQRQQHPGHDDQPAAELHRQPDAGRQRAEAGGNGVQQRQACRPTSPTRETRPRPSWAPPASPSTPMRHCGCRTMPGVAGRRVDHAVHQRERHGEPQRAGA